MIGNYEFRELIKDITPVRDARIDAQEAAPKAAMPLREIRKAKSLTQKDLAEILEVNQPAIAKLENRTDMRISNLRRYIEGLGGNLSVVAKFPHGDVFIDLSSKPNP